MYILLLAFIGMACQRSYPISDMFKWEGVSPESDSLVIELEHAFIERKSSDAVRILINGLDSLSETGLTAARPYSMFWKARLLNREHETKEAEAVLREAVELNDSAGRPYANCRMKYLLSIISGLDCGKMYRDLKEYEEYFIDTDDSFMIASVSLDLGHIMREVGDYKRCISYYLKADSIYENLGIQTYHLKTILNNATIMFATGEEKLSRDIISDLMSNPKTVEDYDFNINVLVEAYHILSDSIALLSAWKLIRQHNMSQQHTMTTALELGRYYMDKGCMEKAKHFYNLVENGITPHTPLVMKRDACRLWIDIAHETGDVMSEIKAYQRYGVLQDSIIRERTGIEIANMESREEIARSEAELESRHQIERLLTWLLVLGLTVVALIVVFLLRRRIMASKLAIARYQLDLERERRSLVSSALVMEEKDNVLESVLDDIRKMESDGKLRAEETRHLEQNVKMHLSGRQDWNHFRDLFDNVHPLFHKRLKESYPELTEGDLRLATYIKVGMQGKQIARMLMLQPDTIRKNRQKLRRHLGLSADESLEDFLRSIDS